MCIHCSCQLATRQHNLLVVGSYGLQGMDIPDNLKDLYKTVWEIKQRVLVDMAAGGCWGWRGRQGLQCW